MITKDPAHTILESLVGKKVWLRHRDSKESPHYAVLAEISTHTTHTTIQTRDGPRISPVYIFIWSGDEGIENIKVTVPLESITVSNNGTLPEVIYAAHFNWDDLSDPRYHTHRTDPVPRFELDRWSKRLRLYRFLLEQNGMYEKRHLFSCLK